MQKTYLIISTILINSWLFSCNSVNKDQTVESKPIYPSFDIQKARLYIDSVTRKFSEEFRNADSVSLASYYTADAEMLFANHDPIKGKEILSAWGSTIRNGIKNAARNIKFTTTDLTGDDEFLIETGTYEMKDEQDNVKDKGKYVVIWKNEKGQWKLYRDIGI